METIIAKGTQLGDMELLPQSDKNEFIFLTDAIHEWEAAKMLSISESRVSELLNGKRALNLNIANCLRGCFGIPADFILDHI